MTKKTLWIIIIVLIAGGLVLGGWYYWKNNQVKAPVTRTSEETPSPQGSLNSTGLPLAMPPGFAISYFAKDLPGARVMALDKFGNMWVSQSKEGVISSLEISDGKVVRQNQVFKNLDNPHGLAIDPSDGTTLYFAEEGKITMVALYSDDRGQKIADLPTGGRHTTRTLGFGPDGRLYVSIGSSCDVCREQDQRRAAIYSMNKDGSDFKQVASGLRNSVFFTWSYVDGRMWATEMGRDNLGDNVPPDEINIISGPSTGSGQNPPDFGWPICYGKNIHDTNFDKNQYIQNPCNGKIPSVVDLQAHSAPLGLAFIPEEGWPEEMWYDLLVAYHGSWNRSEPTGYKIVRIKLDDKGNYQGIEDFVTGFIPTAAKSGDDALGRPVDVLVQPGGIMYVSDDKAGVIYKITYIANLTSSVDNSVRITNIKENQEIGSPLSVEGEAPGTWYFEASFPVKVVDENFKQLGIGFAQAQSDWMTQQPVKFKAEVTFNPAAAKSGWLVLAKDNPSGLPENSAEVHFPIKFK